MAERLYLHIGQPRAGSSAVQGMLADNRRLLAVAGLSRVAVRGGGRDLRQTMRLFDDGMTGIGRRLDADAAWLAAAARGAPGRIAIASAEGLWMREEASIERLAHRLAPEIETRVVALLREPARWLESWHAHQAPEEDFGAFAERMAGHLDYEARLAPWRTGFGEVLTARFAEDGIPHPARVFLKLIGAPAALRATLRLDRRHRNARA